MCNFLGYTYLYENTRTRGKHRSLWYHSDREETQRLYGNTMTRGKHGDFMVNQGQGETQILYGNTRTGGNTDT